jgi:hypothetical protein
LPHVNGAPAEKERALIADRARAALAGVRRAKVGNQTNLPDAQAKGVLSSAACRVNCLPESLLDGDVPPFDLLETRRSLMAAKIKAFFEGL